MSVVTPPVRVGDPTVLSTSQRRRLTSILRLVNVEWSEGATVFGVNLHPTTLIWVDGHAHRFEFNERGLIRVYGHHADLRHARRVSARRIADTLNEVNR